MKKTILFMLSLLVSFICIAQQNTEETTKKSLVQSYYDGYEKGKVYYNAKSPEEKSKLYNDIYDLYSNLKDDDIFKFYVHGVETGSKYTFPWDSTSMGEHRRAPTIDQYNEGLIAGKYYIQKDLTEDNIIRIYSELNSFGKILFKRGVIKGSQNQFPPWKVSPEEYSKLSSVSNDLNYEDTRIDYYDMGAGDGRAYSILYKQYMTHPDNRRYKASKESKEDSIKNSYKGFKNENKKAYQQGVMKNLKEGAYILWPLDRSNNDKYYYQKQILEMYDKEGKENAFFQFLYKQGVEEGAVSGSESLWITDQESYNKGEKDGQEYAKRYKDYMTEENPTRKYIKQLGRNTITDYIDFFYKKLAKNPKDYKEGVIKGIDDTPFVWYW